MGEYDPVRKAKRLVRLGGCLALLGLAALILMAYVLGFGLYVFTHIVPG